MDDISKIKSAPDVSFIDGITPAQMEAEMVADFEQYMKDNAANIFPYLQKGKEIFVMGHLDHKTYVTSKNETKDKYYIMADVITLCGKKDNEDAEQ